MTKPTAPPDEPLFITEEIAAGHVFEPLAIARMGRLRDVLARMTDDDLALQPGEIANQERERRRVRVLTPGDLAEQARR